MQWKITDVLTKTSLDSLLQNDCAAIYLKNKLSQHQCITLVEAVKKLGLESYTYDFDDSLVPPAFHLFEPHYYYEQKSSEEYFDSSAKSYKQYKKLVKLCGFDPVNLVIDYIANFTGYEVSVATQDTKPYFFTVVRELSNSVLLHNDFVPATTLDWSISKIKAQLAWNIYLTNPGSGGETVIYKKLWEKEDDRYIWENTYGYKLDVVSGCDYVEVYPKPGHLMIFNSRNLHLVNKSEKSRIAIGGHIGLTFDNKLIFWS